MSDICIAIGNLQLIGFSYLGHERVVEPHTYGVDKKGHRTLRAYQVRGSSRSGRVPDWRIFHERDMQFVSVLQETFEGPRREYKRGDKFFSTIHCEL
jgi:hypothetical protein